MPLRLQLSQQNRRQVANTTATIVPFFHTSNTVVNYTPAMRAQYGAIPRIQVYYWDGVQYIAAGIFTRVALNVTDSGWRPGVGHEPSYQIDPTIDSIAVDHGTIATGLVKIN